MAALNQKALRRRRRTALAGLVLYVGMALWATWPLARNPATQLPWGNESSATVPLFNVWTLWWNADRLAHGFRGYWDAPIFHPAESTFAFSEPQPATMLVAPFVWVTGSRVLAYNLYLWLSLVLNGVFAERMLRMLGMRSWIPIAGGAAMLLLPAVHWQRGVVQLVPLWGILWTWTALEKVARGPSLGRGAELGAAFAATCLACVHHALFLALLLAAAAPTLWKRWLRKRTWLACFAGATVAAVLAGPILLHLQQVAAKHEFVRTPKLVSQLSAMPGDYTAPSGRPLIDTGDMAARRYWRLSPGWIKVILAVFGIGIGLLRRRWRRWTLFLCVTAALAFLFSLGSNLRIGGWQPWWTLTKVVPGFSQVRNAFRFAFFVQMATVLLAAQALYALAVLRRRIVKSRVGRSATAAGLFLLALAAVLDVRPNPTKLGTVPEAKAHSGWIDFVRENTPRGRALACLPFAAGNRAADFERTTRWMYFGTFHRVPLVNGYSGFFLRDYFEIRREVSSSFPSATGLRRLAESGVTYLVVETAALDVELRDRARFDSLVLELVFKDPTGVRVYRVRGADDSQGTSAP